jgi:hypothetical protein
VSPHEKGVIMDTINYIICLVIAFFIVFLFSRMIKERELGKHLLKYGEERQAVAELLDVNASQFFTISYRVEISFQINNQTIVKTLSINPYAWSPYQKEETIGTCKNFTVLVDPSDPDKFLFNMRKYHLKEKFDDSILSFFERHKAAEPDPEDDKEPGPILG